jgi:hypothetical protein
MISTARISEPPLSGLAGLVHSSTKSVKPGHANWYDKQRALNKPNPAIATLPPSDAPKTDYLTDDLKGQTTAAENFNDDTKPKKTRKRRSPAKKKKQIKKKRSNNKKQSIGQVKRLLKRLQKTKRGQSSKRKTRKRK